MSSQGGSSSDNSDTKQSVNFDEFPIAQISISNEDMTAHENRLQQIEADNKLTTLWNQS
jgi:hypothetical protein